MDAVQHSKQHDIGGSHNSKCISNIPKLYVVFILICHMTIGKVVSTEKLLLQSCCHSNSEFFKQTLSLGMKITFLVNTKCGFNMSMHMVLPSHNFFEEARMRAASSTAASLSAAKLCNIQYTLLGTQNTSNFIILVCDNQLQFSNKK